MGEVGSLEKLPMSDDTVLLNECSKCHACGAPLVLSRVVPDRSGVERRTFE
jgi:hypothetical protein